MVEIYPRHTQSYRVSNRIPRRRRHPNLTLSRFTGQLAIRHSLHNNGV